MRVCDNIEEAAIAAFEHYLDKFIISRVAYLTAKKLSDLEFKLEDKICDESGTISVYFAAKMVKVAEELYALSGENEKYPEDKLRAKWEGFSFPADVCWHYNMLVNVCGFFEHSVFNKSKHFKVDYVNTEGLCNIALGFVYGVLDNYWCGDIKIVDVAMETFCTFDSVADVTNLVGVFENDKPNDLSSFRVISKCDKDELQTLIGYTILDNAATRLYDKFTNKKLHPVFLSALYKLTEMSIIYENDPYFYTADIEEKLVEEGMKTNVCSARSTGHDPFRLPNEEKDDLDDMKTDDIEDLDDMETYDSEDTFTSEYSETLRAWTKRKDGVSITPQKKKKKCLPAKVSEKFNLIGRAELNSFFNESIIDVVNNLDVYSKFGITFPEPFILEGPPGCGKTYAVSKLEEYLGWKSFHITSSSVGSQYIHETAKRIENTFNEAKRHESSIVVIDEMESFMPSRESSRYSDSHSVEEVNSFLKCIQTAQENNILVIGMTNFIDKIDPAILRSGRMGTHIKVSWASPEEIKQVMGAELDKRPYDKVNINLADYAPRFHERPLSDVTAVVRRASMHAARRRAERVTKEDMDYAMDYVLGEAERKKKEKRSIGFGV